MGCGFRCTVGLVPSILCRRIVFLTRGSSLLSPQGGGRGGLWAHLSWIYIPILIRTVAHVGWDEAVWLSCGLEFVSFLDEYISVVSGMVELMVHGLVSSAVCELVAADGVA